jgi:hypothetical protein
MSEKNIHDPRRFLGAAVMTIAAPEFVMLGSKDGQVKLRKKSDERQRGLPRAWRDENAKTRAVNMRRLWSSTRQFGCTRHVHGLAAIRCSPNSLHCWGNAALAYVYGCNQEFALLSEILQKGGIKVPHIPVAMVVRQSFNQWVRRVKLWRHWHPYSPGWSLRDPHRLLQR